MRDQLLRATCDDCGRSETSEPDETWGEFKRDLRDSGWRLTSSFDCCANCATIEEL